MGSRALAIQFNSTHQLAFASGLQCHNNHFTKIMEGWGNRPLSPQGEIMIKEKRKTKFVQVLQNPFLTTTREFNSKKARCK